MAIIKAQALYKQVAAEMRRSIAQGEWTPGQQIPTEDKLCALYDVSRPTVRQAVAALRTEGLLDAQQGRGTFVATQNPAGTTPYPRDADPTAHGWTISDDASATRLRLNADQAAALELDEGEAAFCVDRLLIHETSGARVLHRTVLPMERITGTPLAKAPAMPPAKAYAALIKAHGPVEWRESVTARMPQPDETSAFQLDQPKTLLIAQRVTAAMGTGQPLIIETTAAPADATRYTYNLTPEAPASPTRTGTRNLRPVS
ncbi:GntR family transcriptional regulator [Streptacidiphilus rugosus]|uniref:GntR family transcriptional regulator n=1 Tax=Streptacidiphilus rugosus TaxID=405783 RepID=UPI00055CC263|nr:GntR family transcriptional regulator [Streptacidiphilus rugosus]